MTRPPLGVVRQFARAVFADRLIGDELLRLTMARVSIDPAGSSGSLEDLMAAFMHSWRLALSESPSNPVLFSDAALMQALPQPPSDERLLLLMVDGMGMQPAQAAAVLGIDGDPGLRIAGERTALSIGQSARALLVEDEPLIAADLGGILDALGVEISAQASSADEAVQAVGAAKPDIILADYNLEGPSTGVDAVLQIRETHECPVVFITGFPDRVLHGDEVEPDFVISKPYTADNVRAAVVHCLDVRRA